MRQLIFIFILMAAIITAGCVGGDQKPAATPTPQVVYTTAPVSLAPVVTATPKVTTTPVATPATFVIASPVTTVTDLPVQQGFQTYTNKDYKFSIQHPATWTVSGEDITAAGNVKKYLVTFTDPALQSKQEITITPDSAGLSLEEWVKIFVTQLKNNPTISVVSQDPVQVDGVPAKKVVYIYGTGEYALEYMIILVVKDNNSYYMEFASRKNDYPEYSKEADRMLSTFRFT
jgi:hypothetical protein